jgi:hypothetical protein
VELDVRPEPPEPVRRAIVAALAATADESPSAWWRAGLADQDDSAVLPRSSDGADRA